MLLRWVIVIALGLGLGGCQQQMCTLMDCLDTLTVRASAPLPARYSVEINLDGNAETFACETSGDASGTHGGVVSRAPSTFGCGPEGVVVWASPDEVSVRFVAEDGTVLGEASAEPDYGDYDPNGEDCGGACRIGKLTVPVSQSAP